MSRGKTARRRHETAREVEDEVVAKRRWEETAPRLQTRGATAGRAVRGSRGGERASAASHALGRMEREGDSAADSMASSSARRSRAAARRLLHRTLGREWAPRSLTLRRVAARDAPKRRLGTCRTARPEERVGASAADSTASIAARDAPKRRFDDFRTERSEERVSASAADSTASSSARRPQAAAWRVPRRALGRESGRLGSGLYGE